MAQEQVQQFIDQATQSIQGQRFAEALELLDQAIAIEPGNADANLLRAISLSQTNQPVAANDAFRNAITLAPTNAKARFNFAVHLYTQGEKREALQEARAAVDLDPQHAGARDLSNRIEGEFRQPVEGPSSGHQPAAPNMPGGLPPQPFANQPQAPMPPQSYYQQGYEAGPVHTIGFIEKLGSKWVGIGWGLAVMNLIGFLLYLAIFLPVFQYAMANSASGPASPDQITRMTQGNPLLILAQICGYGSWLGIVIYTIMDIIDRRGNFVWLLLQVPCTCCGGGFISMPIYLLAGRK